jgi:membrane protease YdiL (CAAX protease family)
MVTVAVVLTLHEYYGGRDSFDRFVRPWLAELDAAGYKFIALAKYEDLWSHFWWVVCRVVGYVLVPFGVWKVLFPRDKWRDMGLRVAGLRQHLWIYGLCLGIVIPTMLIVASQPDFGTYYPFYKLSSRSVWDFALWEAMYFAQFLALEMFFRGWILGALRRTMGAAAIFAMAVPYCMIHYGKPYLEAHGAIVAGIVLGTLAMRTRSIYLGFLVHITVAFLMDFLALEKRGMLPTVLWPPG